MPEPQITEVQYPEFDPPVDMAAVAADVDELLTGAGFAPRAQQPVDVPSAPETPVPDPAAVIRSWLPAHTHERAEQRTAALTLMRSWIWTTPAGMWQVVWCRPLFGVEALTLDCPPDRLLFGRADESALRRLRGVLITLGAIDGEQVIE